MLHCYDLFTCAGVLLSRTSWNTQTVLEMTSKTCREQLKWCASYQKLPMIWWMLDDYRDLL